MAKTRRSLQGKAPDPGPYIGTAGWQLPKDIRPTGEGSQLERYAQLFSAVEINSTFYRPHQERTFIRWAQSVPPHFRFAVKMHRSVTHEGRLRNLAPARDFLNMVSALGPNLGPVLVQLPPSLTYTEECADLLEALRELHTGPIVLEPRHRSWITLEAEQALKRSRIARVAADPPVLTGTVEPGGDLAVLYLRLHGSPRVYWSAYSDSDLDEHAGLARRALQAGRLVWVIFDNTASGAAGVNAVHFQELLNAPVSRK